MQVSSVVDKIRSSSGAALKSVQKSVEETALKAAGLGDDEEALYMLNKQAQAYLRAVEAQQHAAVKFVDSFVAAVEDIALREIVRKYSEDATSCGVRNTEALTRNVVDPVKKAYEANQTSVRQKHLRSAFSGLIDCSLKSAGSSSKSLEKVLEAVTSIADEEPSPVGGDKVSRRASTPNVGGGYDATPERPPPMRQRAATTALTSETSMSDDLIGGMFDSKPTGKADPKPAISQVSTASSDLLDLSFGNAPASQPSGASQPLDQQRTPDVSGGLSGLPLDFDFTASAPAPAPAPTLGAATSNNDLGSLGSLGDLSFPAADEEDEGVVRARVDNWKQGKNIRTMLMSLHEIAPSNSGWKPIQWADIDADSDIKDVYKKAVLRVHPDKVQGSAGKKLLAHLVFESLCEQWKVFRAS